jgi:hypothetical protein
MSNLTQTKKVAREVSLDPIPGHTLVIYKRQGTGQTFFIELNPEQQFTEEKKNWWRRFTSDPPSYIAYAVNRNESLKQVITRILLTSQGRAFDLIITIEYHVAAPRRVADRYEDDPLALLEEAIIDSLKEPIANSDWDDIKRRFAAVAENALLVARPKIDRRAGDLGFAIESISLERQLHQKDLKELEAEELREQLEVEQEKERLRHKADLLRADLEHEREVKKLGQEGTLQLKKLELDGVFEDRKLEQQVNQIGKKNAVDSNARRNRFQDGVLESSLKAIDGTASEINSIPQLEAGHRAFERMARGVSRDSNSETAGARDLVEGARYGFLTEGSGDASSLPKVVDLMKRTLQAVEEAGLGAEDKNHLLSVLLHLVAESMLGDEADDSQIGSFQSRLQEVVIELTHYPPELERFIRDNYRSLKERLK